jgi:hypothetical protein
MNISKNKPVALTVLMAPRVCSTTFAASPYFACMRLESLALNIDTHAKAIATGGMLESITRARYHPLTNAIAKPPTQVERSCMVFPT